MPFRNRLHAGSLHKFPITSLGRNANQTLTTGIFTPISWDVEINDPFGLYPGDNAGEWLLPPRTFWLIYTRVIFLPSAAGIRRVEIDRVGTGSNYPMLLPPTAAGNEIISCSIFADCSFFSNFTHWQVEVMQNSGGNLDIQSCLVEFLQLSK